MSVQLLTGCLNVNSTSELQCPPKSVQMSRSSLEGRHVSASSTKPTMCHLLAGSIVTPGRRRRLGSPSD